MSCRYCSIIYKSDIYQIKLKMSQIGPFFILWSVTSTLNDRAHIEISTELNMASTKIPKTFSREWSLIDKKSYMLDMTYMQPDNFREKKFTCIL